MQAQQVRTSRAGACRAFRAVPVPQTRALVRARAAASAAVGPEQKLIDAARTQNVPGEELEAALIALESASKSNPRQLNTVPGRWRLMFSTASKIKAFWYLPIREDINIDLSRELITLESDLGPFAFLIKGTIFNWDGQTGVLDFQFNKGVTIKFFGTQIYEVQPKSTQRKTYTFYYATGEVAAARSSQGGLSLLSR